MDKKVVTTNRKAFHDYTVLQKYEAGIVLEGYEVKSLRTGQSNLKDGYVKFENGQAYLENIYIAPYKQQSTHIIDYNPRRRRKLLLHRQEISKLDSKTKERGLTIVPIELLFSRKGIAKVIIGLAKGKHARDKRDDIRRRDVEREMRKEHKIR